MQSLPKHFKLIILNLQKRHYDRPSERVEGVAQCALDPIDPCCPLAGSIWGMTDKA